MRFSIDNFLYAVKNIVMGGGRNTGGLPRNDSGFKKKDEGVGLRSLSAADTITPLTFNLVVGTANNALQALADGTTYANDVAAIRNNFADIASKLAEVLVFLKGTADETNAKVLKVEEAVDTIGTLHYVVPRDYDEATDILQLRVLASQLTLSTDNDVQLDAEVYIKRAGVALGSDKDPTKPTTILSTTEQWLSFDLKGYSLQRDDVVQIKLITDGHNDTDGEEVLIHALELVYCSTLVSYDEFDGTPDTKTGNALR